MKRKTGKTILMCVGLLFCTCTNLTNPFQNKDEARAEIINWSLPDSVSLNIFSTYNIPVRVLLGEHLDSFKVHVDNNRLWSSQDSVIYRSEIRPGYIYSFPFSFYDTGWQKIKLISYRNNGDSVADSCILRAVSPLKQNPIAGAVGDSVFLNTLPIKDKQVLYIWDFHNGVVIKEYACSVYVKITAPFTSHFGQLYVEDYSGHRSPVTLFEIRSQSSQNELSLTCINDSVRGDTVFSADAQMKFRLEVSGAQQLKNASINGQKFDESQRKGDLFLLGYNLKGLDTASAPQKLDIAITDEQGRSVSRTFYVQFIKATPEIKVVYPEDSMYTAASSMNVMGYVSNIRQNSILYLFIRNNGQSLAKAMITNSQSNFYFEILLSDNYNHISLELYSDSLMESSVLDEKYIYVYYDPAYVDTIAPQIRTIRCNGVLVDSVFTSKTDTMHLEIYAFDNSNKLTVTVNGQEVVRGADELFYSTKVILTHKKEYTPIAIQAKDSAGYLSNDTIYVRYNRLPLWKEIPSYEALTVDDNNIIRISVVDPDGDPILVTMTIPLKSGDMVMNASSGQVSWKPQVADTGTYEVRLEASDEYEVTDTSFTIYVKRKDAAHVKLITSEKDFPNTLWIGETLSDTIKASGTRPFTYQAYFVDSKSSVILDGSDSILHWTPKTGDTGLRKLRIKITDSLGLSDSVTVEIMVLLASVRWEKSPVQCYEKDSVLTTKVILSKPLTFSVNIGYRLNFPYNPGATEKDINSPLSDVIKFKAGDTVASLKIKIFNDSIPEYNERFNIELIGNDSLRSDFPVLECEIIDNDMVTFYFSSTYTYHREKERTDSILVKISKPLEKRLVLSCLVDGKSTAKEGEDFTLENNGKVVFEPGDTESVAILNILDDTLVESDETIVLKLYSDSSFAASKTDGLGNPRNTFTYTIMNIDYGGEDPTPPPVNYSFDRSEMTEYEDEKEYKIAVTLSDKLQSPVTVQYSLDSDPSKTTAVLGSDFRLDANGLLTTGLLTFGAGETKKDIRVWLIDDAIPDDEAFFTLNLHSESESVVPGDTTSMKFTIIPNEVRAYFASNYQEGRVGENENPYSEIMITEKLKKPLEVYFQVDESESDVDSGSDYTIGVPWSVRFMPGETKKDLNVQIKNEKNRKENQKLVLEITGVSDEKIAYVGDNKRMTFLIKR
jgi:hypothetical protein